MCDPISLTLGIVGGVVGVAGAAMGTVGAINQSQTAAAAAEYQADVEEQNRKMYEQQATDIEAQGQWEKRNLALEQAQKLGRLRAAGAASGAALGTGSLLTMEEDLAQTADLDARQLDYDIRSRAWQARLGAWNSGNQANAYQANADAQRGQIGWNAASGAINMVASGVETGLAGYNLGNQMFGKSSDPSASTMGESAMGNDWIMLSRVPKFS